MQSCDACWMRQLGIINYVLHGPTSQNYKAPRSIRKDQPKKDIQTFSLVIVFIEFSCIFLQFTSCSCILVLCIVCDCSLSLYIMDITSPKTRCKNPRLGAYARGNGTGFFRLRTTGLSPAAGHRVEGGVLLESIGNPSLLDGKLEKINGKTMVHD